jgi:hypothetical protein
LCGLQICGEIREAVRSPAMLTSAEMSGADQGMPNWFTDRVASRVVGPLGNAARLHAELRELGWNPPLLCRRSIRSPPE